MRRRELGRIDAALSEVLALLQQVRSWSVKQHAHLCR